MYCSRLQYSRSHVIGRCWPVMAHACGAGWRVWSRINTHTAHTQYAFRPLAGEVASSSSVGFRAPQRSFSARWFLRTASRLSIRRDRGEPVPLTFPVVRSAGVTSEAADMGRSRQLWALLATLALRAHCRQ